MARPRRKPRIADRIVVAIRDRLLAVGQIEVLTDPQGRNRSTRIWGTTYGPGYVPSPGTRVLLIHHGRGRPPMGTIGLIAAIASVTGYSERVIHRALAGSPRAGTRRSADVGCPLCGHEHCPPPPSVPPIALTTDQPRHDLAAVGLTLQSPVPQLAIEPQQACRSALSEALDAAISMGAVHGVVLELAERLRESLPK